MDYTELAMLFHKVTVGFTAYFFLFLQPNAPVELIRVEEAVEDRGALSASLRVEPLDLRQDQSFEKLYKVAGSEGVYIRRAGGLRAVFRNPVYVDTSDGSIPLVPAGTVYCIGEVSQRVLMQLGVLIEPINLGEHIVTEEPQVIREPTTPKSNFIPVRTIRFIDDEAYRRQRLASFVLDVVLSNAL